MLIYIIKGVIFLFDFNLLKNFTFKISEKININFSKTINNTTIVNNPSYTNNSILQTDSSINLKHIKFKKTSFLIFNIISFLTLFINIYFFYKPLYKQETFHAILIIKLKTNVLFHISIFIWAVILLKVNSFLFNKKKFSKSIFPLAYLAYFLTFILSSELIAYLLNALYKPFL